MRFKAAALVTAAMLAVLVAPVGPDSTVPAAEASVNTPTYTLRSSLFAKINAGRANYNSSTTTYATFPSYYKALYNNVVKRDGGTLNKLAVRLSAARTYAQHQVLIAPINAELRRSAVFKRSVGLSYTAYDVRAKSITSAQTATRSWLAGTTPRESLGLIEASTSAVAAWSSADRQRAVAALGTLTYPAASVAATYLTALDGSREVPVPTGWQPIPGSCALPAADPAWAGTSASPGLHAWATDAEVAAARERVELATDEKFMYAHKYVMRIGGGYTAGAASGSDLWLRTQRIGYRWLVADDETSRATLLASVDAALYNDSTGWGRNSIGDAAAMHGAVNALDWTKPTGEQATRYRTAIRNLWVGRFACMVDNKDGIGATNNMNGLHAAALFQAGVYLGAENTAEGAAAMKAGWIGMQPNVNALSDGGWFEGVSYWNLLGQFIVSALSTAENVYPAGSPVTVPRMAATATFMGDATGSDGLMPAFGDANVEPLRMYFPFYAARGGRDVPPMVANQMRDTLAIYPTQAFQLLWWPTQALSGAVATLPVRPSRLFPKTGLAVQQAASGATAWLKGSSPVGLSHTHLDSGSVGLRANDVAWTIDPGPGDYKAYQYFTTLPNSARWNYFHVGAAAHSGIVGPLRPVIGAAAPLSLSGTQMAVNLKAATPGTSSAVRTVTMATQTMKISDRFSAPVAQAFTWRWVTATKVISASCSGAVLESSDGKRLVIRFTGLPSAAVVSVVRPTEEASDGSSIAVVTVTTPPVLSLALDATVTW